VPFAGETPPFKVALSRIGGVEIELIEPGDAAPALYQGVVTPGADLQIKFHHTCVLIDGPIENWSRYVATIDTDRHPIAFQAEVSDYLRLIYTDERSRLGHYLEHLWLAPQTRAQMRSAVPTYPNIAAS
jgi:hypothetical protein